MRRIAVTSLRWRAVKFLRYTKLLRYPNNIVRRKGYRGWSHFVPLITHDGYFELAKRGVRYLAQMLNFGETQRAESVDEIENEIGFLESTREIILIFVRVAYIGAIIVTLFVAYLITRLARPDLFPVILRKDVELLGPIFIKLGQWISTRKDIFPRDICNALSGFQQNATPHSWMYTKHLLKATYGISWRDLFVKFDEEGPIGSGCCAQVYKAWIDPNVDIVMLREPPVTRFVKKSDKFLPAKSHATKLHAVAVKVLHPGIRKQFKRDIAIMRGFCKCATYFVPKLHWLNLADCIDEFARIMENQTDMRLEATNLMKFSNNFSRRNDVIFPYPYMHLTDRKILVESFHEGTPISHYLEYDDVVLRQKLAKIGIATVFKMVFKDNFIHCDLHPGNILVEKVAPKAGLFGTFQRVITPNYKDNLRLIILDCGLVASLSDRCRKHLRDVFHSVLIGNGEMAAQYILDYSSHMATDSDGFKHSMKNIVKTHRRNPFNVKVSTVVTELFSALVRHGVKQDGSFSNVILSMLVIEGLGRRLDPNIDIFTELLPFLVSRAPGLN